MYASFDEFENYNGEGCVDCGNTGNITPFDMDHAVLIVGWDDTLCGGGGWIVKNSWGTDWGDSGFFYIPYCCAFIGDYASVVTIYSGPPLIAYPPYSHDENGWVKNWGFPGYDYGWGLIKVEPVRSELLAGVGFYAVYPPTEIEVKIYDEFNGVSPNPNSILYSDTMHCDYAGYYTLDLKRPLVLKQADPVYIAIRFTTPGYDHPIAIDSIAYDMDYGWSFVSSDGNTYQPLDLAGLGEGDLCIQADVEYLKCSVEGDPGFSGGWPSQLASGRPGDVLTFDINPTNMAIPPCDGLDTFCVSITDTKGWTIEGSPPLEECTELPPGGGWLQSVSITIPLDAEPGEIDTVTAIMSYCDANMQCSPECGDCVDSPEPESSVITMYIEVLAPLPDIYVEQDSVTYVDQGQTSAYIPFSICNANSSGALNVVYNITSRGHIGASIDMTDTVAVAGGECETVYGIIDAGSASICDYDTLTIIAWTLEEPADYDTCVQVVHVVEPLPVPVFNTVVVVMLVVALITVTYLVTKRKARVSGVE